MDEVTREELIRAIEDLEQIVEYGGWDETREDMYEWVRLDQVLEILENKHAR